MNTSQKRKWENEGKILVPWVLYCREDDMDEKDGHRCFSDYVEFSLDEIMDRLREECDFIPFCFTLNSQFVEEMLDSIDDNPYEVWTDEPNSEPPSKDELWERQYHGYMGLKHEFLWTFKELVNEEYDWDVGRKRLEVK